MSQPKEPELVQFATVLQPHGGLQVLPPPKRTEAIREPIPEPVGGGTRGGLMAMRILSMSDEDRRAVAAEAASRDPGVVWFAMLTVAERAEVIRAAQHDLKERLD